MEARELPPRRRVPAAGCRGARGLAAAADYRGAHEQLAAGHRGPCSVRATAAVEGTSRHGARGRREELAAGRPPPPPPT